MTPIVDSPLLRTDDAQQMGDDFAHLKQGLHGDRVSGPQCGEEYREKCVLVQTIVRILQQPDTQTKLRPISTPLGDWPHTILPPISNSILYRTPLYPLYAPLHQGGPHVFVHLVQHSPTRRILAP